MKLFISKNKRPFAVTFEKGGNEVDKRGYKHKYKNCRKKRKTTNLTETVRM